MHKLKCSACSKKEASVYKYSELREAFGPGAASHNGAAVGAISPEVMAALLTFVKDVPREIAGWLRERRRLFAVCAACGHIEAIDNP